MHIVEYLCLITLILMLNNFESYLLRGRTIKSTYVPYYVKWVADCYSFLKIRPSERLDGDYKKAFLTDLAPIGHPWIPDQVGQ